MVWDVPSLFRNTSYSNQWLSYILINMIFTQSWDESTLFNDGEMVLQSLSTPGLKACCQCLWKIGWSLNIEYCSSTSQEQRHLENNYCISFDNDGMQIFCILLAFKMSSQVLEVPWLWLSKYLCVKTYLRVRIIFKCSLYVSDSIAFVMISEPKYKIYIGNTCTLKVVQNVFQTIWLKNYFGVIEHYSLPEEWIKICMIQTK